MSDTAMICPRDGGPMVTYTRAGVQVDQCETCKGIFLDRGELEQLAQAEQGYYQPPPPGYQQQQQPGYQRPPPGGYEQSAYYYDDHDEHHSGHHGEHHGYRRRGFMHELFD